MNRAALVAELWIRLQRVFVVVGITDEDTPGNLKEPVDDTLRALGVAYADLATGEVADSDIDKAIILAEYYGLKTVYKSAIQNVDISVAAPQVSKSKSQFVANITAALALAKAEAAAWIPGEATWSAGTIDLDFVPDASEIDVLMSPTGLW
jgi:hypothetical protein